MEMSGTIKLLVEMLDSKENENRGLRCKCDTYKMQLDTANNRLDEAYEEIKSLKDKIEEMETSNLIL